MLRPYQSQGCVDVAAAFVAGHRRVVWVLPTAAGKTVGFTHLARTSGMRVLIVAHRRELIRQASAKLAGVPHGIIAPWADPEPHHALQVGSVQTIVRRPAFPVDILIVDECHHAVMSGTYGALLAMFPGAMVLGVTATPWRLDGRGLGEVFTHMVLGPTLRELTAAGYLSPVMTWAPEKAPDLRSVHIQAGDFMTRDLAVVMDKPTVTGDAVDHYEQHARGAPALGFCVSIQHAINTAAAFNARGWRAAAVDGTTSARDRDAAFDGLASGAVQAVFSCALIDEGLDVPAVSCMLDLAPTQSLTKFMQRVGRGLRLAEGKPHLVHLDHAGNTLRHGMPDSDRVWTLEGTPRRARTVPAVAQCPDCYALHHPGPRCPACGHDYAAAAEQRESAARAAREVAGMLTPITLEDARLAHLRKEPLRELLKGVKSWDDIEAIREARGYKAPWRDKIAAIRRLRRDNADGSEFGDVAA